MSKHNDGGRAFPGGRIPELEDLGSAWGMSLRDYFAAQAITSDWMGDHSIFEQTELAYKVADAMLAERAKRKEAQP